MKFSILSATCLLLIFSSCTRNKHFTVDADVKDSVQKKLGPKPNNLAYQNELIAEIMLDNKVVRTKKVSDILSFRTFHFWDKDTLKIIGGFGVESGYGFVAKIHNENARIFHLIFSEDEAPYALSKTGERQQRLEIPCESWNLNISIIPKKDSLDPIWGIITFKSEIYYEFDGKRTHSRKTDMDLHFFSRKIAASTQ